MIKKISIQQLKPGMFIHDINCVWMEHPFLVGALKIKNDKTIEKIAGLGVREVYIDTLKGLDVIDAPTETEVNAEIEHKMIAMVQQTKPITITSTLNEELKRSREVYGEANKIISNIMHDVRIG
ncbi:MAG: DUF3391 domain-containing protein, partial [Methylobacter sp.]